MEQFNQILDQIRIILAAQGVPEEYQGLIAMGSIYFAVIVAVVVVLLILLALNGSGKKDLHDESDVSPETVDTEPESDEAEAAETVETVEVPAVEAPEAVTAQETEPEEQVEQPEPVDSQGLDSSTDEVTEVVAESVEGPAVAIPATAAENRAGLFGRLKQGLGKTRSALLGRIDDLFSTHGTIDADLLEELEEVLITADVGLETTRRLVESLEAKLARNELKDFAAIRQGLLDEMRQIFSVKSKAFDPSTASPFVVMVVGVNGVGKTTTIGKLAKRYTDEGKKVVLGAGDTFRAAAAEQLAIWGERSGVDVIKHGEGADPGAVAFDAVKAAVARDADILILDTAGRLHNKAHLMEELKKINRVIDRELPSAPHEILLVLDATTGQNALIQAKTFSEVVDLTGIVMTKLDGTAKGGIIAAICNELHIPIRFIGVGEAAEDLREFDPEQFLSALFAVD